ncbi:TRPM8 channel-associated factor homolog [Gouania willdenowi]|uniref:TRPM8 channel-associated factor homolog n=1 Tax=Gouania willdenowi TaxID=441366 RepID=UPI001055DFE8|nr:TRPM8 channel-associated factor homolog [Gouania willdenowi]XP_028321261.1 TRPM8 channel-associated factor homolog [Gouania willdenowi]
MSTQSFRNEAYVALLRGFKELDFRGPAVPCELVLAGENAFPLVMNNKDQILMAASVYGRGRIVVMAHETYLTKFPALVENAVSWLMGDQTANLVCVQTQTSKVEDGLKKSTYKVNIVEAFADSQGAGVYVTNAYRVGEDPKALVAFLKAGGGVLIAGQAWHWASQHPNENTFLQFSGNKVSGVAGIYFTKNYFEAKEIPVRPQIPISLKTIDVGKSFEDDLEPLLKGVSEFDLQGDALPSEVLAHGPFAFSIGTTNDGQAFLAGSYFGKGRVIVTTHELFFQNEKLATIWYNAIHWLDQGRQGVIGFVPRMKIFPNLEMKCEKTKFRNDLSVFVCEAYSSTHVKEIQEFVAEGGGLLIGGHAWAWAHSNIGQDPTTNFSGNKILNKMGLTILKETIKAGIYEVPSLKKGSSNNFHFRRLLQRFIGHVLNGEKLTQQEEDQLKKLARHCTSFLQMKALEDFSYTQVLSFLTDSLKKVGMPQVSEKNPVKSPKDFLLLVVGAELFKVSPDPDALLPYLIKDIPLMPLVHNQRIQINANTAKSEEWISTGLYLPPAMKTYISIPTTMVKKRWMVQIGCQTDYLKHEVLKRAPVVHERFHVTSEKIQVWNLWGGLIYLVAPPASKVEGEEVIVEAAVAAPYYRFGVTTEADWLSQRASPSPWAEMEFDNVILTVPSQEFRDLDDVDEVSALWNGITKGVAELSVFPPNPNRKERFVADVQISVGWMHAGYPIMMHSSIADQLFKHEEARTKGLLWGEIHELGHNQQRSCWEFPPHTTEATCNLWSVYVHEEVLGVDREKASSSLTLKRRKLNIDEYVQGGRNLSEWKVWTALETYLQIQEKFGWNAFKKVFAAYHTMDHIPNDNNGKMNLYAEVFSRTVGMNLTEFFKAWGWPIEEATVQKVSSLPSWDDHPMVQYA